MKNILDERVVMIQQQIDHLERDYKKALLQDKQFQVLKQIRRRIKILEEASRQLGQ